MRTSFDARQEFLVSEGDLDGSTFGGDAAVRVTEIAGRAGEDDYLVVLPADWSSDLVTFAHGDVYGPPEGRFWFPLPLGFDAANAGMWFVLARDVAVCHGFALAASAYSRHGLAIEEAIRDTHLMLPLARRHLPAEPRATYVTGLAIGGLAAVALAEAFPQRYDGALAMAARLGDRYASIVHEWANQQAVARAGAEDLYSGRLSERYETITQEDVAIAFRGLDGCVETGVRPAWPATP